MAYFRIVLTVLVILSCLLGDTIVELTQHPLLRALLDNGTHAFVGALTGVVYTMQFHEKISKSFGWTLIITCFAWASLIDIDHFVEARSLNLEVATNLARRPFLHCTTIIGGLFILYLITACFNYLKSCLLVGIIICSFFTHHTRDAVRRGYWIYPFGQTERITRVLYITLTALTPYLVGYTYSLCSSTKLQQFLGQFIQVKENNNIKKSGYCYLNV